MPFLRPNRNTFPFPNYSYLSYDILSREALKGRSGIYLIINNINKNLYIGSSVNLYNRWGRHKNDLRSNRAKNSHLQNAWNKYGEENFIFGVIQLVDKEELLEREQLFLDKVNTDYNICRVAGSTTGYKHTEKGIEKMKKNHADVSGDKNPMHGVRFIGEKNHMYGRKRPDTSDFNKRTKKGKTWEEMYGVEKARKMKKDLELRMRGNTHSKKPIK